MSAPCFCGCGKPADEGSLWRDECRRIWQLRHDQVNARREAKYARAQSAVNTEHRQTATKPCRRCGKPIPTSRVVQGEIETERREVERKLAARYGEQAYTTSIALTATAGAFSAGDYCPRCYRTVADTTFYGDD